MTYPEMRRDLIEYIGELADLEHQRRAWGRGGDDLVRIVDFLLDDTSLQGTPERALGASLDSPDEVRAVAEVAQALGGVLAAHGRGLAELEYVAKPEWAGVVSAAFRAYRVLRAAETPLLRFPPG